MNRSSLNPVGPTQTFTLYAVDGRVYATNVRQKLIDLGRLVKEGHGFAYVLDGEKTSGTDFPTEEAALKNMGESITFLYLDGQFTALEDLRGPSGPNLADAVTVEIQVDELGGGDDNVDTNR